MAIIEARGLARTFKSRKRTVEAVRGVDLTVGEGEIVGFLGPNGAGKTTTLRMLTTLLKPTAGTTTVAGADLLALFGSTFVGFAIISDWRSGVIERFRVTPVNRLAIMAGRVLRDVVTLVVQAAVLVLVGVAFGLRAPLPAVLIGFVFIMFVAIGLASVSYATGLLVKSEDAFAPLINTVVVPLLLLSGIFLPLTLGPGWLQGIARISPFRYIIDAMREAYLGHYFNTIMVEGIAVAVGMAAIFLWLGSRVFVQENA
jgi:ABC-2 type transport system permease protein